MRRRGFLALLPLPWLEKLLPRCTDARTWPLPEGIPVTSFVYHYNSRTGKRTPVGFAEPWDPEWEDQG